MSSIDRRHQMARSLATKAFRDAFVTSIIRMRLPSQIREMRMRRNLTQAQLGELAGMRQALVSRFETKGYERFTLSSLRRIASALDVGLKVQFVPFSELLDDSVYPERRQLDVCSFDSDPFIENSAQEHVSALEQANYASFNEDISDDVTLASLASREQDFGPGLGELVHG